MLRHAVSTGAPWHSEVIEAVGAICVRSDVERKRLFGLSALQSPQDCVPGGIYDEVTTARTYSRLNAVAHVTLGGGWPVVVDAAFLCRSERAQFAALAALLAVPFSIFECRAALPLLRQRLEQRRASGADPAEADVAVLERLSEANEREHAVAIIMMPRNRCRPRHWRSAGSLRRFSAASAEPITQVPSPIAQAAIIRFSAASQRPAAANVPAQGPQMTTSVPTMSRWPA